MRNDLLRLRHAVAATFLLLATWGLTSPMANAQKITGITFDMSTVRTEAPGSDNWAITWANDGHQYTTWGDGGGFGGTNSDGRVSFGVARVEGSKDSYHSYNVWGGKNAENPAQFSGKSYGLLSVGSTLYMWRCGSGSGNSAYNEQALHVSSDHGATWQATNVTFTQADFPNSKGFFCPTFLQFGRGYQDARDNYVYSYAPEIQNDEWEVQKPGQITLMRVPKSQVTERSAYEYFAGFNGQHQPQWTRDVAQRQPVFSHPDGVMRTSVSYNKGLGRYVLITQVESRQKSSGGRIGIYEAPEPWGPWSEVLDASPWELGLQTGSKTVYWNFSNKWLSSDGQDFVLVYSGPGGDEWGTVEGTFTFEHLPVELSAFNAVLYEGGVRLTWQTASETNNAGFEIHRRASSEKQWTTLAFVEGAGTTVEPTEYQYRVEAIPQGRHQFRLKQVDFDGTFEYSPIVEVELPLEEAYELGHAYPNPFAHQTEVQLTVSRDQTLRATIHDLLGRQIAVVHDGPVEANTPHKFTIPGSTLPSGLYILHVNGEMFSAARKLMHVP